MTWRDRPALLVGLGLAAVVAVTAAAPGPDLDPAQTADLPVVQAQRFCPLAAPDIPASATAFDAASDESADAGPVAPGPETGALAVSPLAPDSAPVATATDLSRPLLAPFAGGDLLVQATGPAAAGLAVSHLQAQPSGSSRALAGGSCPAAAVHAWYVGGGGAVGQRSTLVVANTEATPATVEVAAWSESGPISPDRPAIVAVAPHSRAEVALDGLAPGAARIAVSVRAVAGRISSALLDRRVEGTSPRGADWIEAGDLARRLVVGPLPAAEGGARLLQIAAPGTRDAVVSVRLVTPDGSFAPAGSEVVEVKAGTVAEVDATAFADGREVAVELSADVPIAATARLVRPGSGALAEEAFVAGVSPASAAGVLAVAESRWAPETSSVLLVTALEQAFRGTLRLVPADPAVAATSTPVEVAAGTTAAIALTLAAPGSFGVVLTPAARSGPAEAVRVMRWSLSDGPTLTAQRLERVQATVPAAETAPDLGAGLPGH